MFTALGKGKLWLVTELRLTGRERQPLAESLSTYCSSGTASFAAFPTRSWAHRMSAFEKTGHKLPASARRVCTEAGHSLLDSGR